MIPLSSGCSSSIQELDQKLHQHSSETMKMENKKRKVAVEVEVDLNKFRKRCLDREKCLTEIIAQQREVLVTLGKQVTNLRRHLATKWKDPRLQDETDWKPLDCLDQQLFSLQTKQFPVYIEPTQSIKNIEMKDNETQTVQQTEEPTSTQPKSSSDVSSDTRSRLFTKQRLSLFAKSKPSIHSKEEKKLLE